MVAAALWLHCNDDPQLLALIETWQLKTYKLQVATETLLALSEACPCHRLVTEAAVLRHGQGHGLLGIHHSVDLHLAQWLPCHAIPDPWLSLS